EPATGSAGRSTTGTQSRQLSASESAFVEEPVQTTCKMEEPSHPVFKTDFSNFIMNRLSVDTLTPKLLAGPTYELLRESCNSLTELEYHLEEVYKATMDQLDWDNPEGNFKRLRLQDIEDMLILLVQGKLSNLTVEERFTFNVSLRMFTRSIVIQRRVEDL
nr:hypothetical protein [Tanacetum cinerariifolium]